MFFFVGSVPNTTENKYEAADYLLNEVQNSSPVGTSKVRISRTSCMIRPFFLPKLFFNSGKGKNLRFWNGKRRAKGTKNGTTLLNTARTKGDDVSCRTLKKQGFGSKFLVDKGK